MTLPDLLDGTVVENGGLAVANPANGQAIFRVRDYGPTEVSAIIASADAARPAWSATTAKARAAILQHWRAAILANRDELVALITAECGKPLAESDSEVAYGAAFIKWFAEEGKRAYGETIPTFAENKRLLTIRQPIGTCVAILPGTFRWR